MSSAKFVRKEVLVALAPIYRDVVRAAKKTFGPDVQASRLVLREIKYLIRANPRNMDEAQLQQQLIDAKDFITFNVVQAQLNPNTGNYKVKITDDHVKKGAIIDLNAYDPAKAERLPWVKINQKQKNS